MSEPTKAVFLSYASQDAEAARKICDALRAAGIEVWFDSEGGLEHGDEWDRKIRRQIKECVLFIAVISANTQAREEGYFRIEWELAAQRALGIAAGVAFILPVVIDDTREPAALVPDRFRSVQWMRLLGGNVPPDVLQRFLKLWSHRTGVLKQAAVGAMEPGRPRPGERGGGAASPVQVHAQRPVWPWLVLGVLALGAAYLIFKPRRSPEEIARIVADAQKLAQAVTPPAPAVPLPRDWPKDPELRRAMDLLNGTEANSEDFTLAEEISNRVIAQHPTDPEAVTVMARTQGAFLIRGFDRSDERVALARRYAERAVQLAPNDAEALAALGSYVARSDQARAVELLNQAIALKPTEPFFYRQRDNAMFNNAQVPAAEAMASAEKTAALFPNDALAHYELARHYRDLGRGAEMEQELDRTIAITPIANAVVWKSRIALWVRGDPAEMKALIDRVPARVRSLERVVFSRWAYAMATGQWTEGRNALDDLTSNWIEDFDYIGPKALLAAQLLEQQGKPELARLQYEAALAELRARQARTPGNATLRSLEVWIAHGLGRDEEARTLNRTRLETIRRPYQFAALSDWWFSAIPCCLLIGDRATALTLIREAVTSSGPAAASDRAERLGEGAPETAAAGGRAALRMRVKFDPRMAPFRGDPEIQALLAEPAGKSAAAAPNIDDKSVAVLAFANLSDDKANEYFSDGISEELLTVLQKIPGLHVAARTSAFFFKGKSATAQEIGEKLGVATLVEGSVRKAGNSVRITARLSRAATGEQLWSESYTRDLKDVFAVQSELAETIVGQLRGQFGGAATKSEIQAQVQAAEKGGTKNVEAHELYLQGKYFLNRATLQDTARATALLQRAVELDPNFALAWAALSGAGWFRGGYGLNRQDFDEGFALARRAADQAVAIEPALAAGHIARLDLQAAVDFDWAGARESLRRAQALAPDDVAVIFRGAQLAYSFGQMDRAVDLIRKTGALDPVNPLVYTNAGYIFLSLRRFDEAIAAFNRVRELSPESPWGHAGIAMALVGAGRNDEARAEAALGTTAWSRLYALSLAEWGRKNHGDADRVLAQFIAGNAEVAAYQVACVYAWRGETDHAFEWLERAYRQRDPGLGWGRADFFLQGLHADPRWAVFMKKLGVTDEQLP